MKGKVFVLIALLALAILIAGCKEQAGEAAKMVSPGVSGFSNTDITNMRNDLTASRSDIESLKTQLSYSNNKYDSLVAENNALKSEFSNLKVSYDSLKADLAKFTNNANNKFNLLNAQAKVSTVEWDKYPISGFSWSNVNPAGFSNTNVNVATK